MTFLRAFRGRASGSRPHEASSFFLLFSNSSLFISSAYSYPLCLESLSTRLTLAVVYISPPVDPPTLRPSDPQIFISRHCCGKPISLCCVHILAVSSGSPLIITILYARLDLLGVLSHASITLTTNVDHFSRLLVTSIPVEAVAFFSSDPADPSGFLQHPCQIASCTFFFALRSIPGTHEFCLQRNGCVSDRVPPIDCAYYSPAS